ncbi:hypothetical protein [Algicella marina]|uniref:hypothetical protein n=1 Tax=Algicella marina TaxID=2683284 RepID=UPI001379959B|nr:hypothetical protein [Algicella marina]
MDCDIYVSTREALAIVAPLVDVGSVIIFDDWFSFRDEPDPSKHWEKRAFAEWELRDCLEPLAITYNWNASFVRVR